MREESVTLLLYIIISWLWEGITASPAIVFPVSKAGLKIPLISKFSDDAIKAEEEELLKNRSLIIKLERANLSMLTASFSFKASILLVTRPPSASTLPFAVIDPSLEIMTVSSKSLILESADNFRSQARERIELSCKSRLP